MEVNSLDDLEKRIELLKKRMEAQKEELKIQLQDSVESLKPANLVKSAFASITGGNKSDDGDDSSGGFLSNALGFLSGTGSFLTASPKNSLVTNLASTGLGLLSKRINKSVKGSSSEEVINSSTRKGIVYTLLTVGVGFLANRFFKTRSRNIISATANSALKTAFTTVALANIDKIAAYITAIIKTDFGKKSPEEV